MASPDLSLILLVDARTGQSYVSLRAIGELEQAIAILKDNLAEIEDCIRKIKTERARISPPENGPQKAVVCTPIEFLN